MQKPVSQTRPAQQSDVSPQPWFSPMHAAAQVLTLAPGAIPQKGVFAQQPPAPKPALQRSPVQSTGWHFSLTHFKPSQHCSDMPHA